ncbi:acyltransferase family protein [Corynebacterium mayonis]|uniref:acyltransferase family protein n=1 Tax=Corynebacterium mayonis TaxID=3062461 RepID=UPI0031401F02
MGAAGLKQPSPSYRVDLDGLRGIAIALVVVFHVFVGRVSGGVDVFLLLSGYFFLGSQLRYALRPEPSLNPWWPIWRTIRRLVPTLVLVVGSVYLLVRNFAPQLMNIELARQFTASVLYYQNWELSEQEADYAAASHDTSVLQHLWSMSVQGQFYLAGIIFGLLVAVAVDKLKLPTSAARKAIVVILTASSIASFAWASRFGLIGTPGSYYSTFSRAWELSLGALLAMAPATFAIPRRFSTTATGAGLAMIALTGVVITSSLAFPGPLTLLPLTGASLIVLSNPDNPVSRFLSSAPMTWLGDIAYSLYLWHWPLLIIATVVGGFDSPPLWLGAVVIVVSVALAHITHLLVERPLRQHARRPQRTDQPYQRAVLSPGTVPGAVRGIGGALAACLAAATLMIQPLWNQKALEAAGPLDPHTHPGAMALRGAKVPDKPPLPDPALIAGIYPPIGADNCMIARDEPADSFPGEHCIYGDLDAETTIVLVGGSHIEPFVIPLDSLGKDHRFKVVPFVRQECPLVTRYDDIVSSDCAGWSALVVEHLNKLQPDLVISTSTRPAGGAGDDAEYSVDEVPDSYVEVWHSLRDMGIAFLGLRDNPWITSADGDRMDPNLCMVGEGSEAECSMPADDFYSAVDPSAGLLDGTDNLWGADTAGWYCPKGMCPPIIGNIPVYRDQNHISNAYAASLTPLVWEILRPIFDELDIFYDGEEEPAETEN